MMKLESTEETKIESNELATSFVHLKFKCLSLSLALSLSSSGSIYES